MALSSSLLRPKRILSGQPTQDLSSVLDSGCKCLPPTSMREVLYLMTCMASFPRPVLFPKYKVASPYDFHAKNTSVDTTILLTWEKHYYLDDSDTV